jgi:hypothetical protein
VTAMGSLLCEDLLCKLKALFGVCDKDYDRLRRLVCNDC